MWHIDRKMCLELNRFRYMNSRSFFFIMQDYNMLAFVVAYSLPLIVLSCSIRLLKENGFKPMLLKVREHAKWRNGLVKNSMARTQPTHIEIVHRK